MKTQISAVSIAAMLLFNVYHAFSEQAGPLKFDFRAKPKDNHLTLVCRAQNLTDQDQDIRFFGHYGNTFSVYSLHDPERQVGHTGRSGGFMQQIPPHRTWQVDPRLEEIFLYRYYRSEAAEREGRYGIVSWKGIEICLGMADIHGNMRAPVTNPAKPEVEMFLGFIFYHPIKAPDVCFLFLNGTKEAIEVENPLKSARITIKSPDIDDTDELHIRGAEPETVIIEAGKVGEWKMPWRDLLELIPKKFLPQINPEDAQSVKTKAWHPVGVVPEADIARMNAAGGRFDLTWHAAGRQSLPLPVVLPHPGEKERRLQPVMPWNGGPIP